MPRKKAENTEETKVEEAAAELAPKEKPKRTPRKRVAKKAEGDSSASPHNDESTMPQNDEKGTTRHSDDASRHSEQSEESQVSAEGAESSRPSTGSANASGDAASESSEGDSSAAPQNDEKSESQKDEASKEEKHGKNGKKRQKRGNQQQYEPSTSREDLEKLTVPELREKAGQIGIDASGMKKAEIVEKVYVQLAIAEGFMEVCGILDILPDGYGFLRMDGYLPSEHDVYVSLSTIRRNGLRKGDKVAGQTRPARSGEKFAAINTVTTVNDVPVDEIESRPKFSELTPIYPDERLIMEHGKDTITARVVDLVAPIGKGQRGLIVSPPKAGKTTILKDIAASIHANNPEVYLMCLLVDERPEEVTDMERSIHGEVISSTFDMPCENHIQVSELVIERAKRLVEQGRDVVILLDSITRLARAYNLGQPASGRVLSGGVDSTALYPPKRFLGAARNIEHGGSLTILASALIDTGSKMDEVIFEEFKGTGNMELKLDRNLADRRIFPAIDPISSGTRKEELLLDPQEAPLVWAVRGVLGAVGSTERATAMLIKSLKKTGSNAEFLIRSAKKAQTHVAGDNFEL